MIGYFFVTGSTAAAFEHCICQDRIHEDPQLESQQYCSWGAKLLVVEVNTGNWAIVHNSRTNMHGPPTNLQPICWQPPSSAPVDTLRLTSDDRAVAYEEYKRLKVRYL